MRAPFCKRMLVFPDVGAFELAPDWICEIASPSTTKLDRIKKLPAYAREEVQYAWIIDPIAQSFEAFQLVDRRWSYIAQHEGDDVVRAAPFDAIEIRLARLWVATPQPPQS